VATLQDRLKAAELQHRKHKQKAKERLEKERQEHNKQLQSLRGQSGGYSDRNAQDIEDQFHAVQEIERHRDLYKKKMEEAQTKLLQCQAKNQSLEQKQNALIMQNAQLRNQHAQHGNGAQEKLWLEKQYSKQLETHYQQLVKSKKEETDMKETIARLQAQLQEQRNINRRLQNREKDKEEFVHSPTNASKTRRKKAEKKPKPTPKVSKRKKRPHQPPLTNSGVVIPTKPKPAKKRQLDTMDKKYENCFVCRERLPKRVLENAANAPNGDSDVMVCVNPWYDPLKKTEIAKGENLRYIVYHKRCCRRSQLRPETWFTPPQTEKVAAE